MSNRRVSHFLTMTVVWLLSFSTLTACSLGEEPAIYAYSTADELIVMRDQNVVTRTPITSNLQYRWPTWTLNGRYLTFITDGQADDETKRVLVAIDTTNGSIRRLPCPSCTSVAAIGESSVLTSEQRIGTPNSLAAMLRYDLASNDLPVELSTTLPSLSFAQFLAGTPEGVLVVGIDSDTESYYLLSVDGSARLIGTKNARRLDNTGKPYRRGIGQTTVLQTADGPLFAVDGEFAAQSNECSISEAFFVSPSTGSLFETDISPMMPQNLSPGNDAVLFLNSLWWSLDDKLHAVMIVGPCGDTPSSSITTGEWVLDGNRWMQVSNDKLLSIQEINEETRLVARVEGDYEDGGTLYLETKGNGTKIAEGVFDVSAPLGVEDRRSATDIIRSMCPSDDGSPCLAEVDKKVDLGSRSGDIDGDGESEEVSLTFEVTKGGTNKLVVSTTPTSGKRIDWLVNPDTEESVAKWLGITDINGDGRDEILVVFSAGAHSELIRALEYSNNGLAPLRGGFGDALSIDRSLASYLGFSCEKSSGRSRLITSGFSLNWDSSPPQYEGGQSVYEADAGGAMNLVDERDINYSAVLIDGQPSASKAVTDLAGAHCPGLDVWPK